MVLFLDEVYIRVMENNYTSQVNITVDHSMDSKSVTCTYNNGSSTNVIGITSISLTKGKREYNSAFTVTVV